MAADWHANVLDTASSVMFGTNLTRETSGPILDWIESRVQPPLPLPLTLAGSDFFFPIVFFSPLFNKTRQTTKAEKPKHALRCFLLLSALPVLCRCVVLYVFMYQKKSTHTCQWFCHTLRSSLAHSLSSPSVSFPDKTTKGKIKAPNQFCCYLYLPTTKEHMSAAPAPAPPRSALAAGSTLTTLPLTLASDTNRFRWTHRTNHRLAQSKPSHTGFSFVCDSHARRLYGPSTAYAGIEIDLTTNSVITFPFPRNGGYRGMFSAILDPASACSGGCGSEFPAFLYTGRVSCGRTPTLAVLEPITEFEHKFVLEHHISQGVGAPAIDQSDDAQIERTAVGSVYRH